MISENGNVKGNFSGEYGEGNEYVIRGDRGSNGRPWTAQAYTGKCHHTKARFSFDCAEPR